MSGKYSVLFEVLSLGAIEDRKGIENMMNFYSG